MYERLAPDAALSQGDVIEGCPLYYLPAGLPFNIAGEPATWFERVVVLTQACDLAQKKAARVVVAAVYDASAVVAKGIMTASAISGQVRQGKVFGWYFLPAAPDGIELPETLVNLREIHTVERRVLEHLTAEGKRICRLQTPWREHLAQHFGVTYMRIALPEPYPTQP